MFIEKKLGIIGVGIMGRNLALNFERHGYVVSLFNRSKEKIQSFLISHPEKCLKAYFSIKEFVLSLEKPRCILIMVKSGSSVDQVIVSLIPFLEKGDLIIDGGNSFYKDTIRRNEELLNLGVYFIGLGVSGGELGALWGASLMPGGQKEAYVAFESIFRDVSARFEDEACITYIGENGSGHYVKMIHNGIEYADMQLISESYSLLKNFLNLDNAVLSKIFSDWNCGELGSYLIDITSNILLKKDENGLYLLDCILDEATHNGTGQWTSQNALDFCEPANVITESVFARYLSMLKFQRICSSKVLFGPSVKKVVDVDKFIEKVRKSLYFCKVIAYSQGFSQLRVASGKNNWDLNYCNIAKIFRSGCIIRAKLLQRIVDAYIENPLIVNLLLSPYFSNIVNSYQESLREIISYAVCSGIPIPAFSSALGYYDAYRSSVLPANLLQAQRDYFGAHGYKRVDREGFFHTNWCDEFNSN